MAKTTVVNVKTAPFDVYIGRPARFAKDPRCHEYSHFANPYALTKELVAAMGEEKAREHVIELFRQHLLKCLEDDPGTWIPRLRAIKGKVLGCWCKRTPGPSWPPFGMLGDGTAEFQVLVFTHLPLPNVAGPGAPYHIVLRVPFRGIPAVDGSVVKLPWKPIYGQLHLAPTVKTAALLELPSLLQKAGSDVTPIPKSVALLIAELERPRELHTELRQRFCLAGTKPAPMLTKTSSTAQAGCTLKLIPSAAHYAQAFLFGEHLQLELVGLRLYLTAAETKDFSDTLSSPVSPFLHQIFDALSGPGTSVVFLDRCSCSHVGMLPHHVLDYKDTPCHGDTVAEFADLQVET